MPIESLAQRVKLARTKRGLTQEELADLSGMKQPDVSKIERGQILQTTGIARLSAALSVSPDWLELGIGQEPEWDARSADMIVSPLRGVAHGMSLQSLETVPSTTWEQLEMTTGEELPRTFRICIEDSSMAPRVKAGAWVHFNSRETARPGDGVLVRDRTGRIHFRVYRAGRPGCFEAHAENKDYQPLDSQRAERANKALVSAPSSPALTAAKSITGILMAVGRTSCF